MAKFICKQCLICYSLAHETVGQYGIFFSTTINLFSVCCLLKYELCFKMCFLVRKKYHKLWVFRYLKRASWISFKSPFIIQVLNIILRNSPLTIFAKVFTCKKNFALHSMQWWDLFFHNPLINIYIMHYA